jgi:hypothetical protein
LDIKTPVQTVLTARVTKHKERVTPLCYVATGIQNNLYAKGRTSPLKWQKPVKAGGLLLPKGRTSPIDALFCMRTGARARCRDTVPWNVNERIASYLSPPFT